MVTIRLPSMSIEPFDFLLLTYHLLSKCPDCPGGHTMGVNNQCKLNSYRVAGENMEAMAMLLEVNAKRLDWSKEWELNPEYNNGAPLIPVGLDSNNPRTRFQTEYTSADDVPHD